MSDLAFNDELIRAYGKSGPPESLLKFSYDSPKEKLCCFHQIYDFTNLTVLSLTGNNIEDISNIQYLRQLKSVNMSWNQISKIDGFLFLPNLESLSLTHNKITSIPPKISNLKKLKSLRLGFNFLDNINDFNNLTELLNLTVIDIEGNPVAEKNNDSLLYIIHILPQLIVLNRTSVDTAWRRKSSEKFDHETEIFFLQQEKNKNSELKSENQELHDTIEQIKQQLDQKIETEKTQEKEEVINNQKMVIQENLGKIEKLEKIINEQQSRLEKDQKNIEVHSIQLSESNTIIDKQEQEISQLKDSLKNSFKEIEEQKRDLSSQKSTIKNQSKLLESDSQKIDELEMKIIKQKEEFNFLTEKMQKEHCVSLKAKEEVLHQLKMNEAELQKKNESLKFEIEKLKSNLDEYKEKIDTLTEEHTQLLTNIPYKDHQIEQLKSMLADHNKTLIDFSDQKIISTKLLAENESLKSQSFEQQDMVSKLEVEVQRMKAESQEKENLQEQFEKQCKINQSLTSENETLKNQVIQLTKKEESLIQLEQKLQEAEKKLFAAEAEVKKLRDEQKTISKLREDLKEKDNQIQKFNLEIQRTKANCETEVKTVLKKTSENEKLMSDHLKEKEDTIQELQRKLQSSEDSLHQASIKMDEFENLQREHQQTTQQLLGARKEFDAQKQDNTNNNMLLAEFKEKFQKMKKVEAELKKEAAKLRDEQFKLKQELSQTQLELTCEREMQKSRIEHLEHELEVRINELKSKSRDFDSLSFTYERVRRSTLKQRSVIRSYQHGLAIARAKHDRALASIQEADAELVTRSQQVKKLEALTTQLKTDLYQVKTDSVDHDARSLGSTNKKDNQTYFSSWTLNQKDMSDFGKSKKQRFDTEDDIDEVQSRLASLTEKTADQDSLFTVLKETNAEYKRVIDKLNKDVLFLEHQNHSFQLENEKLKSLISSGKI